MFFEDLQPPVSIKIHVCSETGVLLQEFKAPCKIQITEGPHHQPLRTGKLRENKSTSRNAFARQRPLSHREKSK